MSLKSLLKSSSKAVKTVKAAVGRDPYDEYIVEAQKAKSLNRWREAADAYEQALALRESFGLIVQLGHMNKEAGDLESAEAYYFRALEQRPDDADLNLQIGHFFFVKKDLEKSVEFYQRAVDLDPDNGTYRENLKIGERRLHEAPFKDDLDAALKALKLSQWAQAERLLRSIYDKGVVDYVHLLGHAVKEQGRIDEAIAFYEVYYDHVKVKPGPEAGEVAIMIGQALRIAGRFPEAARWLMQARAMRMAREGWVGSVDNVLNDVEASLRRVYPWLETSYIR